MDPPLEGGDLCLVEWRSGQVHELWCSAPAGVSFINGERGAAAAAEESKQGRKPGLEQPEGTWENLKHSRGRSRD